MRIAHAPRDHLALLQRLLEPRHRVRRARHHTQAWPVDQRDGQAIFRGQQREQFGFRERHGEHGALRERVHELGARRDQP